MRNLTAENSRLRRKICALEEALRKTASTAERLEALVYQDSLTGLPNRRFLDDSFRRMLASRATQGQLAVLLIDIDDFKRINDSVGHGAADGLLRELAATLQGLIRASDVPSPSPSVVAGIAERLSDSLLSRLGGDEFVILLPDVKNRAAAESVACRILQRLEHPFHAGERNVSVTASIGIAIYPCDGHTADVLMSNADAAMYEAKRNGKARYEYHRAATSRDSRHGGSTAGSQSA